MTQEGISYFPLDTGFLRDKKMLYIKGQYGARGILIVLYILCRIYEDQGYYIPWDADDAYLSMDEIGCGVSPGLISQVVDECVRRSLFDGKLFDELAILTSRGIQKRYLRAARKRENIVMIREYLLLDLNDPKDVPAGMSNKVILLSLADAGTNDKGAGKPEKVSSGEQSKVKESKLKEIKKTYSAAAQDEEEKVPEPARAEIPKPEPAVPGEEPSFILALIDGSGYEVYSAEIEKYAELYPAVDVRQEYREMIGWLDSHPKNRKTRRGIQKFVNGWLARAQDSARPAPERPRKVQAPPNRFHNFEQRNTDYDSIVMDQLKKRLEGSGGQPAAESAGNAAKRQQASG